MAGGYERAAKEIIPAVRSALIKELKSGYGITEESIARHLDVTQAAISKYVTNKYSKKSGAIEERIDKELVRKYAKALVEGNKKSANICICTICNALNDFGCKFSYANRGEGI